MILVRWITTFLLIVAIPSLSFADAPMCAKQKQFLEVEKFCKDKQEECLREGIPERKVIKCGVNPLPEVGYSFVGCLTGVLKSAHELVKFVYNAGKFVLTLPFDKGSQTKVKNFTQAQALNVSMLQGYVKREFAVTKRNMGMMGKLGAVSDVAASATVATKIMGPIFKSIASSIEDYVESHVHNFSCYNAGNRSEMLCKVAADFALPPAGAFALWKAGGKLLASKFPNIARALAKITQVMVKERKLVKASEKVTSRANEAAKATKSAKAAVAAKAATSSKATRATASTSRKIPKAKLARAENAVAFDMHETWRKALAPGAIKEHAVPETAFLKNETAVTAKARLETAGAKGLRVNDEGKLVQNINRPAKEVLPELMAKNNIAPAKQYVAAVIVKNPKSKRDFEEISEEIHNIWKKNNDWQQADKPQLFGSFKELTPDEQLKDLDVLEAVLKKTDPKVLKSKAYLDYRASIERRLKTTTKVEPLKSSSQTFKTASAEPTASPEFRQKKVNEMRGHGLKLGNSDSYVGLGGTVEFVGEKAKVMRGEPLARKFNRVVYNIQEKYPGTKIYVTDSDEFLGSAQGAYRDKLENIFDDEGNFVGQKLIKAGGVDILLSSDYLLKHSEAAYAVLLHETSHMTMVINKTETVAKRQVANNPKLSGKYVADRKMLFVAAEGSDVAGYKMMAADEVEARFPQMAHQRNTDPVAFTESRAEAVEMVDAQKKFLEKIASDDIKKAKSINDSKINKLLLARNKDQFYEVKSLVGGHESTVTFRVEKGKPFEEQIRSQIEDRLKYLNRKKIDLSKPVELEGSSFPNTMAGLVQNTRKNLGVKFVLSNERTIVGSNGVAFGKGKEGQLIIRDEYFQQRAKGSDRLTTVLQTVGKPRLESSERLSQIIEFHRDGAFIPTSNVDVGMQRIADLKVQKDMAGFSIAKAGVLKALDVQAGLLNAVKKEEVRAGTYELETGHASVVRVSIKSSATSADLDFVIPHGRNIPQEIEAQISARIKALADLRAKISAM